MAKKRKRFLKLREFFSTIYRDYFPERREVENDGIHAKLNYQNIADAQRRSMSILLLVIVALAFVFSIIVFNYSLEDVLVKPNDVKNYSEYMTTIREEVLGTTKEEFKKEQSGNDKDKSHDNSERYDFLDSRYKELIQFDTLANIEFENQRLEYLDQIDSLNQVVKVESNRNVAPLTDEEIMLEGNTSLYWGVFFTRFLLVRILIGVTIGIIIAFLIRIYFRIRHDRAVNIHKEEALSTIQYVARGEWRLSQDIRTKKYMVPDHIKSKKNDTLSTQEFLKTLPIATLFKAPDTEKSRRRGKSKPDKELVDTMKQIVSTLSKIEEDLRGMKGSAE